MKKFSAFILALALWGGNGVYAHDAATAQYIANEGVLVKQGETKVLFDPFYGTGFGTYAEIPPTTHAAMMAGEAPFDGIDAVFVSHAHPDHFSALDMIAFMKAHEDVRLIAPSQAVDMMKADENWQADLLFRIDVLDMAYGDSPKDVSVGAVRATATRIPHAGWPDPRRAAIQNMVYRVTLGGDDAGGAGENTATVMHMGDADVNDAHYAPFEEHWQARVTDTGFPPYWFLLSEEGKTILKDRLNIDHAVGVHVPIQIPADLIASGEDYFSTSGERRPIE